MTDDNIHTSFQVTKSVTRNISLGSHRTSVRLEPEIWQALTDICTREQRTFGELCSEVARAKPPESSLTGALRIFAMYYFRYALAEQEGSVGQSGGGRVSVLSDLTGPMITAQPCETGNIVVLAGARSQ
jgi:predicted DNA-binding ribbon-helix-helix protein